MLSLDNQLCTLVHMNTREEKHGEEDVLTVDLSFSSTVSNDFLSELSPVLKSALFDQSPNADLASGDNHRPVLRFPYMEPIRWKLDMTGCEVALTSQFKSRNVELEGCKVNKLVLDCKEGGSVDLSFRVQAHVTPGKVGKLAESLSKEISVSLVPPSDSGPVNQEE